MRRFLRRAMAEASTRDHPTLRPETFYCALTFIVLICGAFCSFFQWYLERFMTNLEALDPTDNDSRRPQRRSTAAGRTRQSVRD